MDFTRREFVAMGAATLASPLGALDRARLTQRTVAGGPNDFMIVRHLQVEGTNRQIGRALAELARKNHGSKLSAAPVKTVRARKAYFAKRYPELYARGQGAADALGAPKGIDPFGLAYDLGGAPGCSTVYYPPNRAASGNATLSRNYDFSTGTFADITGQKGGPHDRPFTGDPYVVEAHPDRGYPSLYIVAYDLLAGCIDGMNSEGLSVAILADDLAEGGRPTRGAHKGLGEIEVPRFLLDRCKDVPDAIEALKEIEYYYSFIPCHYLIGDRQGRSFVWEHSIKGNRPIVVRGDGPQVVTNHLLSEYKDPEKHIDPDPSDTFNRYCHLQSTIAAHKSPLTVAEMKRLNASVAADGGKSAPAGASWAAPSGTPSTTSKPEPWRSASTWARGRQPSAVPLICRSSYKSPLGA